MVSFLFCGLLECDEIMSGVDDMRFIGISGFHDRRIEYLAKAFWYIVFCVS